MAFLENSNLGKVDLDALLAFAVCARERNQRRAARDLHITQPPLSRKIRRLESALGLSLFTRSSSGLELTEAGERALALVRPFLQQARVLADRLDELGQSGKRQFSLGLTTAFGQDLFLPFQKTWELAGIHIEARRESPRLLKDVSGGRLDAAFVALPLATSGLKVATTGYSELFYAVISDSWAEAAASGLVLKEMNGRNFFWFARRRNPAYFDYMMGIFKERCFAPVFIEEPAEHEVLMARIAFGDGWTILPQSQLRLARIGVKIIPLECNGSLRLQLGFVWRPEAAWEILKNMEAGKLASFLVPTERNQACSRP